MTKEIPPKLHARAFLEMLEAETAEFCFRTFPDRKDSTLRPRTYGGSFENQWEQLQRENKRSAGVFVVINGGGQKRAEITRVRAVFADTDGAPLEPILEALTPHIVVESSPGKWHVYWLVDDAFPLSEFRPVQLAIAERFCTDRNVSDLPRVMRVPGFYHNKAQPHLTRLITIKRNLPHYTLDEVVSGLDFELQHHHDHRPRADEPNSSSMVDIHEVERALAYINPFVPREQWIKPILALAYDYGEQARELAHRWSRGELWAGKRHET